MNFQQANGEAFTLKKRDSDKLISSIQAKYLLNSSVAIVEICEEHLPLRSRLQIV